MTDHENDPVVLVSVWIHDRVDQRDPYPMTDNEFLE